LFTQLNSLDYLTGALSAVIFYIFRVFQEID